MMLFRKPVSVKGALLLLLLPAGIDLMATAWLVHGLLLERMSREFVGSRLKDEVALDFGITVPQFGHLIISAYVSAYALGVVVGAIRKDPLAEVWDSIILPLLKLSPWGALIPASFPPKPWPYSIGPTCFLLVK